MAYCHFSEKCKVNMFFGPDRKGNWGYQFDLLDPIPDSPQTFVVKDSEAALAKMLSFQKAGLGVPDYAIDRLKLDVADKYRA